jgi:thiol-disulfide isomerase/thioredoxin
MNSSFLFKNRRQLPPSRSALVLFPRGGNDYDDENDETIEVGMTTTTISEEESLDDRVYAAMRRLGLEVDDDNNKNEDSVAPSHAVSDETTIADSDNAAIDDNDDKEGESNTSQNELNDARSLAERLSTDMNVPIDISVMAVYSTLSSGIINEEAARSIVQTELNAVSGVPEYCDEVHALIDEGYDNIFLVRRALAFSEMNVDDARAILIADREDELAEEEENHRREEEAEAEEEERPMKTVTVDFPQELMTASESSTSSPSLPSATKPPPARIEDVVFEGTAEELHKLVIESPVPVLLDIYADWCGPCKQLTPALEQICVNAGGMLRLVKINTDQQRSVSGCLDVKSLPTVFGMRDGQIINSFQGMPRDEKMIREFLMSLIVPGQKINPPLIVDEETKYKELSSKLLKLASTASLSFSSRENLQSHVKKLLDELVDSSGGSDVGRSIADDSARTLRSLLSNVINHPFDEKFRKIKLDNRIIATQIACHPSCIKLLRTVGFVDEDSTMVVAKGKKVVNIAPFVVARDAIDRWIDRNRHAISAAGRKRRDEMERARLASKVEEHVDDNNDDDDKVEIADMKKEVSTSCILHLRMEGTKKIHDVTMDADDTLIELLAKLPFPIVHDATIQFTCVARRLTVRSTDNDQMSKTLSQLRLTPTSSIVVKVMNEAMEVDGNDDVEASVAVKGERSNLAKRAALQKKKKVTGSHSMHSIGLYSTADGDKAETFESGGVLYEHVVSDDEDENANEEKANEEVEDGESEDRERDDDDDIGR